MAGPETTEEVVSEDVSDEEALRQMEEAFAAGPGATSHSVVDPPVEEDAASGVENPPQTTVQSDSPPAESGSDAPTEEKANANAEAVTNERVLELLNTSQTTEELRDGIKKLRDEAFGKLGGLERTLKALQEGLNAPGSDEDLEEHFKDLKEQYPDAAPLIIKGIQQALKKAKSIAITTGEFDPEEVTKKILPRIEQTVEQKFEERFVARTLDREHKGWREIVGEPGSDTEFRRWVNTKPEEERNKILSSYDVDFLSETLTAFKASQQPKSKPKPNDTPKSDTRAARLEAAVTPKSQIKPPAPRQKTPEEEMEEGFRAGPAGHRVT